ncbi:N-acetyltransferase B complex non catalytic subunit-domain-containing protein [Lasiosphaeria miniovina]|uniref:N-acetyltransferase B complex non catalytic subunit-domain-containing protein n=1 Tax=Lasiosphaeria miniovina TaxID=1954250 RepID=A0AA40ABK9_9PEZI|nr:N-acetyltransferase B complex non catalytic subunit-domain-containing protein [Lasiosphaeria miniovina]KAK0712889.1 N-acetyltransferase B complex non catalytic subunit-domain-containing protein [Lasiosphaeria miniovina]
MSSYYSRYGRPALKNSVDMQLQTAFSDGNWNTVARLADKRAKALKDPYYEAIKITAESQLDGGAEKCAVVLIAIDDLVRQKAVPDLDTLELYEWASHDFLSQDLDYAEALGPLRARWVKANPKSPLAQQCLQTCLEHWDLVSAQQIAATLDKANVGSNDRRYMFWGITLTYLLSVSHQCTEASRRVYSLLVLKQLERAADLTENATTESTDRRLATEEEICLYYRVLLAYGTKADFISRIQSSQLGAIAELKKGHKLLLWESLTALESWGEWDLVFTLCRDALNIGIEGLTPPFLVCDLLVWGRFSVAASKAKDPEAAFGEVQAILNKFISLTASASEMYKKNISVALLETTFRTPTLLLSPDPGHKGLTPRVIQIGLFLDNYFDKLSAFDDVKYYVAQLSFEEARAFMEDIFPKILDEQLDELKKVILKTLECRLRYLLTTCPQTLSHYPSVVDGQEQEKPYRCRFCSQLADLPCEHCLRKTVVTATATYKQLSADSALAEAIPRLDKDPRADLALVMGLSLLKLAGLRAKGNTEPARQPLRDIRLDLWLQALLLLDTQLKLTPSDVGLRLLLVQLYLQAGCASYALQLWKPMDVKRTIQDALSPLFFDRISSLSPGLFQGGRPLMEPLRSYYASSLRDKCPVRVWEAFSSGSYTSIIDMSIYDSKLRKSCTLVMTLVEERRAMRYFAWKTEPDIDDQSLAEGITDETVLVNKTDYGSFPNLESLHGPPIQDFLRLGPGLSNERLQLGFLSEQYYDVLAFKPPKDYKPAKPNDVAIRDRNYVAERVADLSNSLTDFLHRTATPSLLTSAELVYYTVVSLLSASVVTSLYIPRADPAPPKTLSMTTSSVRTALAGLRSELTSPRVNPTTSQTCKALTNMHNVAYVRETAVAVKHTAAFVLAFYDNEMARDRTGKSALHKDVVAEMKALEAVATKTLAETKAHVQKLKEQLGEAGWLDRMLEWAYSDESSSSSSQDDEALQAVKSVVSDSAHAEEWGGKLLESWREGVKGWGMVRME